MGYTSVQLLCLLILLNIVSKGMVYSGSDKPTLVEQRRFKSQLLSQNYKVFSTTMAKYDSGYGQIDDFKIGSEYCENKSTCSELKTFPEKLCHCDRLCGLMNDCCGNYDYTSILPLTKDKFECVSLHEIVKNPDFGVTMVSKCSSKWTHEITKALCESKMETDNILLRLPVSDKTEYNVMYRNMFCAQCNFVTNYYFWKQEIFYRNKTGVRSLPGMDDRILFFIRPHPQVSYRTCQLSQTITSTCRHDVVMTKHEIDQTCINGAYAMVYDNFGRAYRNKYCAMCNGVAEKSMFCEQISINDTKSETKDERRNSYSFRMIIDFNTRTISQDGLSHELKTCRDDEMYDWFSEKCRPIYCPPTLLASNGMCNLQPFNQSAMLESLNAHYPIHAQENCTLTKVDPSEYDWRFSSVTNNTVLYIFTHDKAYSKDQFYFDGSDAFVCLDKVTHCSQNCKDSNTALYSDAIERCITLIGLIVSILSLAITLVVYIAFPQLLNTPGKILVSLIIALLLAQIMFVSAAEVEDHSELCTIVAVLVHYFFLAAFCWMNIIAFDLWMTFSSTQMTRGSERKRKKRFIMYSAYAWLLPVVIVCVAIILDFVTFDNKINSLKPGYGKSVCWISSRNALILFFAGPLAVFKSFDIISFVTTAVHIARAKRQGAMATRKKNTCSFIVNLKLSVIMGLTWVFAFVANATNETTMWYLFIIFNSVQGLFIATCFLFTKKVGHLMNEKYHQVTSKIPSGTQTTSLM